jgi:protein-L-isoaspartate O-methyltransferase
MAAMAQNAQCVRERAAMVETICAYARWDGGALPQGISESVLEAVAQTERHRFIPGCSCSVAYRDGPVPIGQGQTISQPYIVALMTHLGAVIVTAALGHVPPPLIEQLKVGGRLVMPLGSTGLNERTMRVSKSLERMTMSSQPCMSSILALSGSPSSCLTGGRQLSAWLVWKQLH